MLLVGLCGAGCENEAESFSVEGDYSGIYHIEWPSSSGAWPISRLTLVQNGSESFLATDEHGAIYAGGLEGLADASVNFWLKENAAVARALGKVPLEQVQMTGRLERQAGGGIELAALVLSGEEMREVAGRLTRTP
jgi:hypothetical protein